ncbi:MAG: hypothetical protein HZA52_02985 [Planctomycetes bacterium]|nr:hypothetical protein [Planctomycetota bacterium]
MRIQLLAFVLLIASCSALFAGDQARPAVAQAASAPAVGLAARLRAPERPWTIDVRGGQAKLIDLVASFEAASGEHVSFSDAVRTRLAASSIGLTSNATVPAEQVYTWFEALMAREGYRMSIATHDEPRMLALHMPAMRGADAPGVAYPVLATELPLLDRHPALMVHAVVDVWPLDARALMNSVRALFPESFVTVVAGGASSLTVVGSGADVGAMLRVAEGARLAEVARLEREPKQPAPAAQPTAGGQR